jgi:trk system potassium uptake protein TrkA
VININGGYKMKFFDKEKKRKGPILIIGSGRLGATLANDLSDNGEDVIIIDKEKDAFRKLSPSFGGLIITGDARNQLILKEGKIEDASIVVVVTDDDNTNILISQLVKEIFQKTDVISRLYDPEREKVYEGFDIQLIYPAVLSVMEINRILNRVESN